MLDFFVPEGQSPESPIEIMMIPLMLLAFGVVLYNASLRQFEFTGKRPKWMPAVWGLLGLAVLFGIQRWSFTRDMVYANTLITRKIQWAHLVDLIAPIVVTGGILAWEWRRKVLDAKRLY